MYFSVCGLVGLGTAFLFILVTQRLDDSTSSGELLSLENGDWSSGQDSSTGMSAFGAPSASAGLFGTAVATMGMLSTVVFVLAMDVFGPITDNAGGIVEMSEQPETWAFRAPEIFGFGNSDLDAVGNTTKAITKGFSVGSASLACFLLFSAFLDEELAGHKVDAVDISVPEVFLGGIAGATLVFYFSGQCMTAVGSAAQDETIGAKSAELPSGWVVNNVRTQFRERPGIMDGSQKPDYASCVTIVTQAALREMVAPGIVATTVPLCVGFFFRLTSSSNDKLIGAKAIASFLMFATSSGVLFAIFLNTAGGAWDNAKKYIEQGVHGGKGSAAHKAAVTGDTVGDPSKDTAGPSLHVLIKLLSTITLALQNSLRKSGRAKGSKEQIAKVPVMEVPPEIPPTPQGPVPSSPVISARARAGVWWLFEGNSVDLPFHRSANPTGSFSVELWAACRGTLGHQCLVSSREFYVNVPGLISLVGLRRFRLLRFWASPRFDAMSGSKPQMLMCYLCGREFGSRSLPIHVPQCEKKWLAQAAEAQKPLADQRPLPPRPERLNAMMTTGALRDEERAVFNEEMYNKWDEDVLEKCTYCGLTKASLSNTITHGKVFGTRHVGSQNTNVDMEVDVGRRSPMRQTSGKLSLTKRPSSKGPKQASTSGLMTTAPMEAPKAAFAPPPRGPVVLYSAVGTPPAGGTVVNAPAMVLAPTAVHSALTPAPLPQPVPLQPAVATATGVSPAPGRAVTPRSQPSCAPKGKTFNFCSECGAKFLNSAKFCHECGVLRPGCEPSHSKFCHHCGAKGATVKVPSRRMTQVGTGKTWEKLYGSKVVLGRWTHLRGTVDTKNKEARFYVDHQLVARGWASYVPNTKGLLRLGGGAEAQPKFFFTGDLKEVCVLGRVAADKEDLAGEKAKLLKAQERWTTAIRWSNCPGCYARVVAARQPGRAAAAPWQPP
eukprot:g10290.t1